MSNEVYPQLPGLAYGIRRFPMWSTDVRTTPSQREYRSSDQIYPRRRLRMEYEYLRDVLNAEHIQTLEGFFNRHHGRLESFLVNDPEDNTITDQVFGVTDGSTSTFQLVRARGNFVEPISALQAGTEDIRWISSTDYRGPNTPIRLGSRINDIVRSNEFSNAAWNALNASVTDDLLTAPNGTSQADRITPDTTNGVHAVYQTVVADSSAVSVCSVYVRPAGVSWIKLRVYSAGFSHSAWANFNVGTGALGQSGVTSGNAVLEATKIAAVPGASGWYRIEIAARFLDSATAIGFQIAAMNSDGAGFTYAYAGNGTSGFYLWLAQRDAGVSEAGWPIATVSAPVTAIQANESAGLITFTTTPVAGATLAWSGSYYWRARFEADELDFEKFLDGLWRTSRVDLLTTRT